MIPESDDSSINVMITGASSGLGYALAVECASRGMNLILVALPNDNLEMVANEIEEKFGVEIQTFELDLSDYSDFNYLLEALKYQEVNWLINNVGLGGTASFLGVSEQYLDHIIDVNIRHTCLLIYHLLPKLVEQKKAHILNIGSLLSGYPVAYKTIYPASKAFIHLFSLGLREELKDSNIIVSVALPGPMDTNHDVHIRLMEKQKRLARIGVMSPRKVAKIIINQTVRNKVLIIPGFINKICWFLMKIVPHKFGIPYLSRIFLREKIESSEVEENHSRFELMETDRR